MKQKQRLIQRLVLHAFMAWYARQPKPTTQAEVTALIERYLDEQSDRS